MLGAQRTRHQASAIEAELASVRSRIAELTLRRRRTTQQDQQLLKQLTERSRFLEAELSDARVRAQPPRTRHDQQHLSAARAGSG
jgi:hypothetical protein